MSEEEIKDGYTQAEEPKKPPEKDSTEINKTELSVNIPVVSAIEKFTGLITNNPMAFITAVFCLMFYITHTINVNRADAQIEEWKKLYIEEKKKNDDLQHQLLIKAGIIQEMQKKEEVVKEESKVEVDKLLENTELTLK